jgi:thioredoxin-like negative regulator of GroEL
LETRKKMDSASAPLAPSNELLMDRKTFFLGLFFAVVVILAGYYVLNKILSKDGFRSLLQPKAPASAPSPQAHLERSPFVQDVENDSEAIEAISASGKPKVILVHAPWCGHCRNMMGAFIQAASTHNSVDWIRADGNIAQSLVRREDLRGFPTIYGVSADGTVTQHVGARDAEALIAFAKKISNVFASVPVLTQEAMIQAVKEEAVEKVVEEVEILEEGDE